jgi:hypothetical protein
MAKGKKKNGDKEKPEEEIDFSAMLVRAMNVFSDLTIPDEKKLKMIHAIETILAEPDEPNPDDPKGA